MVIRRNQPKSLSGIETVPFLWAVLAFCRNQPKSLSGIETVTLPTFHLAMSRRNQPKSLSGIETCTFA